MEREAERQLNEELLRQSFYGTGEECAAEEHRRTALCYARTEGAVAVLSDLREQRSLVCCGGFAERLGLGLSGGSYVVGSIWEEEVLRRIHPEDLQRKYLLELRFLRWMRQHPARCDCYLCEPLRMSDAAGASLDALHRMFYLAGDAGEGIRWALCLYGPRSLWRGAPCRSIPPRARRSSRSANARCWGGLSRGSRASRWPNVLPSASIR